MKKISLIFQEILRFLLWFALSFIWLRYFLRKLWLSSLLSVLISISVELIFALIKRKKQTVAGLKLKEKEDAENMFFSLACESEPIDFFVKLAATKHKNITKHKDYLVIYHEKEKVKTLLYADFSFEPLTVSKFMEIYKKVKRESATKIVICCKEVDKQTLLFSENFSEKFLILDRFETYEKLFKFYNYFPQITQKFSSNKKMVLKDFIAYSFNKKRTKGYLFAAFILILSSLFVRATIYYCLIASLLIVFGLISQFNPRFNRKTDPEIL